MYKELGEDAEIDPSFPLVMDAAEGTVAETVDEGYSSREIAAETAGESEIEAAEEHASVREKHSLLRL